MKSILGRLRARALSHPRAPKVIYGNQLAQMANYASYSDINGSLVDPFWTVKWVEGSIWDAFYHRQQALICRGLAASCFHYPTRDALLEIAAEHDAKADRLERSKANCSNDDADR